MKCPVDDITLVMSERSGVEIDYCPTCRGVWLDRGELDKILDRVGTEQAPPAAPAGRSAPRAAEPLEAPPLLPPAVLNEGGRRTQGDYAYGAGLPTPRPGYPDVRPDGRGERHGGDDRDDHRRDRYDRQDKYGRRRPKKKNDWLSDIFDF